MGCKTQLHRAMSVFVYVHFLSLGIAAWAFNVSVKGFGPARHFVPASSLEFSLDEEVSTKFRLLNWNILAPTWDNFGVKKSNWQARFTRILQEMRLRKPDVMVLQEVEVLIYDEQIQPFLKARGYQGVFTGIDAGIGAAVFWRSSKFALGTAVDFELTGTSLTPWRPLLNQDFNEEQRETGFQLAWFPFLGLCSLWCVPLGRFKNTTHNNPQCFFSLARFVFRFVLADDDFYSFDFCVFFFMFFICPTSPIICF